MVDHHSIMNSALPPKALKKKIMDSGSSLEGTVVWIYDKKNLNQFNRVALRQLQN